MWLSVSAYRCVPAPVAARTYAHVCCRILTYAKRYADVCCLRLLTHAACVCGAQLPLQTRAPIIWMIRIIIRAFLLLLGLLTA